MTMDVKSLAPEWVRSLTPYPPGKPVEELEREYGISDSIKLASNENPLGPSPKAVAAVIQATRAMHRYPDGEAFYLRRALAQKLGISPDSLLFGNGSNEIIELAARSFLRPGDEAVMAAQTFIIYRSVVQAIGGSPKEVPLRNYTHDLDAIAEAIGPRTKMVFLANPNNPTGTIFKRREWEEFLGAVPKKVLIVMDEAYSEFVEDPEYPNSLDDHAEGHLIITLRTFSKIYGLAALRIGYGVAAPEVIDLMNRVRQPFNVSSLAQIAALAALDDREHVEATRKVNREGLAYLKREFDRIGRPWVPSWANFILVNVGNGAQVYERLLRLGVIVRPMGFYGFADHVRVTVGTPAENERFVAGLEEALAARETRDQTF
jgi:histidinol-phosphate aminotransferase